MSILNPDAGWPDIDGINTNERLLGGENGPLNRAPSQLAARTKQLRDWRDSDQAALAAPDGSDLVGFQQLGTGTVPRTMLSKARETRTPYDFGAVGDGIADDTASLSAWLAAIENFGYAGRTGVGQFRITGQLSIPVPAQIDFSGSRILCGDLTSGAAVKFVWSAKLSPDSQLVGVVKGVYSGLSLGGKFRAFVYGDETFNVTAMELGSAPGSGLVPIQNIALPDLKIAGFKRGIEFLERTWCLMFDNCFIGACWDRALSMTRHNNSGENIRFKGGTIFNCQNTTQTGYGLYVSGDGVVVSQTGIYFDGTSFDYNDYAFFWNAIEGQLMLNECHIESNLLTPFGVQNVADGFNYVMLQDCTIVDNSPQTGGLNNGRSALFAITGSSQASFRIRGGVLTLYSRGPFVFDLSGYTGDQSTLLALEFAPGQLISGAQYQARMARTSRVVRNGNFETGTAVGWTTDSAKATLTPVTSSEKDPLYGTYSGKIVSTEAGGFVNYSTDRMAVRAGQIVKAVGQCERWANALSSTHNVCGPYLRRATVIKPSSWPSLTVSPCVGLRPLMAR